ncbi:hypothetical protein CAPTEDRAFT_213328 [Capitella teleta]|uniref:Uncharacterized protein n=1 Tax=Capitella teleta TaxID=283909 RepID=R7TP04_CAPTE|nr:hypothetical protein CAPTEDRAFT_213328 [Capitella teleta]|eukprot:ELT95628.1 hypothetical protein CAPTEDRAFT_213328 [Capitella teleta]
MACFLLTVAISEVARTGLITEEVACTSGQCSWKELTEQEEGCTQEGEAHKLQQTQEEPYPNSNEAREHVGNISSTDIAALQTVALTTAFFSSISIDQDSDTDTASEGESDVPSSLSTVYDPSAKDLSPEDLSARCGFVSRHLRLTSDQVSALEEVSVMSLFSLSIFLRACFCCWLILFVEGSVVWKLRWFSSSAGDAISDFNGVALYIRMAT